MMRLLSLLVLHVVEGNSEESCQFEESALLHLNKKTAPCKPPNFDELIRAYDDFYNLTAPSPEIVAYYQQQAKEEYEQNQEFLKNHGGVTRQTRYGDADPNHSLEIPKIAGKVDYVFTWGAPGTGSPGLRPRQGTCFPGTRAWAFTNVRFRQQRNDPVAFIANGNWFWHSPMDTLQLHDEDPSRDVLTPCDPSQTRQPPWEFTPPWDFDLHLGTVLKPAVVRSQHVENGPFWGAVFDTSYENKCPECAQTSLQTFGWNVVGAAHFPGSFTEGEQSSFLLQEENTLDCIVTFQGSVTVQDHWTNAAAYALAYCGLTEEGDTCCPSWTPFCTGECRPRGSGISFVHQGFRNQLRRMVSVEGWQNNVRPKLPFCSSVTVFGHSLGGGLSELFRACVDQNLIPGDFGYDDFSTISWVQGNATKLPPRPSFA